MSVPAHPAHALVEWLDGRGADVGRIGGKAASLDRLAGHGFRIPPGFCLTTDAFATQVATLPGSDRLAADPAALGDGPTRAALVDAMLSGPLAPSVASVLADPLTRLGHELGTDPDHPLRLAVRSSGVAEDGTTASFAGLHDTELGLTADEVAPAVLRCWASLWSDRAIGYRTRRGLPLDGGAMAVVVQALVPALAAAVAFTRHPVTGRAD
ncbi:MAG TPA: PEP/pyruvate-binding domain-containing protein, partial [Candidatus Deferrimicrobium sp.]|nr:PEP/pyruvate-binding domain-containing protein [Candidatus Deferrimicrobium sp.]